MLELAKTPNAAKVRRSNPKDPFTNDLLADILSWLHRNDAKSLLAKTVSTDSRPLALNIPGNRGKLP